MLLKESYASTGVTEVTTFELLESLPSLNESLSSYNGEMVPIRHNSRLGKNLIQLEDFYKYSTINNFEDGDAAIGAVCESNMISVDGSIGFMVNEASLYANDELAQLAEEVKTAGYPFYVSEISSSSNYYKNLQEALALDEGATCFEESQALQAFCEGVLEDKLAGVINHIHSIRWSVLYSIKPIGNFALNLISSSTKLTLTSIKCICKVIDCSTYCVINTISNTSKLIF